MTAITVRAPDSAQAMDEVLRRLGSEAYILSTVLRDGLVEICASAGRPPRPAIPVTGDAPAPGPHLPLNGSDRRLVPDPDSPAGGWPGLADAARADLAASLYPGPASAAPDPATPPLLDRLARALLPAAPLALPARILIIGPPGAGKSTLAARIAARMLAQAVPVRPVLVAPRLSLLEPDSRLRIAARLLGLPVERPILSDFLSDAGWVAPRPEVAQIIDLSCAPQITPGALAAFAGDADTRILLALPTGLHPGVAARLCAGPWPRPPLVCLTRLDQWTPTPEELAAIAHAGLSLGWLGQGTGLVDTLAEPDRDRLRDWAEGWVGPRPAPLPATDGATDGNEGDAEDGAEGGEGDATPACAMEDAA